MYTFDLRLKEEELKLTLKDGSVEEFVMREISGTQRDIQQKFVYDQQEPDGRIINMQGIKEHLLGMQLFRKEADKPVGTQFFEGMADSIRAQMYDIAQRLNGDKTEAEVIKMLQDREIQKVLDRKAAEDAGEVYVDPDLELAEQLKKEKAEGKE
jgi:hypothetical protein